MSQSLPPSPDRCWLGKTFLALWLLALAGCPDTNFPPEISPIPNPVVEVNTTLLLEITATDPDGDYVALGVEGKPAAAIFSQMGDRGLFQWTPIASDAGPGGEGRAYQVTFTADDGRGGRDSAFVVISVVETTGSKGAPEFVSASDYLLDLRVKDRIEFVITVRDDNSVLVTISLEQDGGIKGYSFEKTGNKEARFSWQPNQSQIEASSLFIIKVAAKDEDHPPAYQDITIRLRRKSASSACPGTAPAITHEPLQDTEQPEDFPVQAAATDAESRIQAMVLYWFIETGQYIDYDDIHAVEMTVSAGAWEATIPNPNPAPDSPVMISYLICAIDDDDPASLDCDNISCIPAEGAFHFVAYSPSGPAGSCKDDFYEENDSSYDAASSASDTLEALRICPDDEDWFAKSLNATDTLEALTLYNEAAGKVHIEIYGPDGWMLLGSSEDIGDGSYSSATNVQQSGVYYLRAYADAGVQNSYDMAYFVSSQVSCDDEFEPNNSISQAASASPLPFSGSASICSEDEDYFGFDVTGPARIDMNLSIDSASQDLDLQLLGPDGHTLRGSYSLGASESLSHTVSVSGYYFSRVFGYGRANTTYSLSMSATPGAACTEDFLEPNTAAFDAALISEGDYAGLTICPDDEDWYVLRPASSSSFSVSIYFSSAAADLDMMLYDAGLQGLKASTGTGDSESVSFQDTGSGSAYYVKIYSVVPASVSYDMDVDEGF